MVSFHAHVSVLLDIYSLMTLTGASVGLLAGAAHTVNKCLPDAYMDEIFHVPQTQKYCAGLWFEWDDKITTPPGLYGVGLAVSRFFGCHVQGLRLTNILGLLLGSWVCAKLLKVPASYIITFPLLFFFSLVYYTDVWSTLLVLAGLGFALERRTWVSSSLFTVSLLFRQTNIVWAGLAALCAMADEQKGIFHQIKGALSNLTNALPYLECALAFAGFLYWNGGITLGDKSNHTAGLNLCQMLYFSLFVALFSGPQLDYIKRYLCKSPLGLVRYTVECLAIYLIYTTQEAHPFILADNRHYTFYLWRRILTKPVVVPLYHYAISWMLQIPFNLRSLGFWLALAAVLIPSPLLEPRYYMVGFLVWRLMLCPRKITKLEIFWNMAISVATVIVFCHTKTHFMW